MAANKPFANLDRLSKLATPSVLSPSPSTQQGESKINSRFANQISLSDRLRQSGLGTTKHLAQYFVTDVFTNVIKIKKPIEIEKVSNVLIAKPVDVPNQGGELPRFIAYVPIQGGEDPRAIQDNLSQRQGIIQNPLSYDTSAIQITLSKTIADVEEAQGIVYLNGSYFSVTRTNAPVEQVSQGTVVLQNNITVREQGSTDAKTPVSTETIRSIQGIVTRDNVSTSFIRLTRSATEAFILEAQHPDGGTKTATPTIILNQGEGTTPTPSTPINPEIADQAATLKTLSYVTKGIGLRLIPEVVQGGQRPTNQNNQAEIGFVISNPRRSIVSAFLNPLPGTAQLNPIDIQQVIGLYGTAAPLLGSNLDGYATVGTANNKDEAARPGDYKEKIVGITAITTATAINEDASSFLSRLIEDWDYAANLSNNAQSPNSTVTSTEVGGIKNQPNPNIPITDALGSTDNDPSTTIISLINTKIDLKEHRGTFTGTYKHYGDVTKYQDIIQAYNRSPRSNAKRPESDILITDVGGGDAIGFTAFIKTFSDSVSAAYADYKHVGQMDTFKVYGGTTRQISLAFDAVALKGDRDFTRSDMTAKELQQKIDILMRVCTVGLSTGGYIKGPVIRVSVAGMINSLICACTSVKVDVPISDVAWDIDSELPHMYNISLDLTPLAMNGDGLLARGGAFYR